MTEKRIEDDLGGAGRGGGLGILKSIHLRRERKCTGWRRRLNVIGRRDCPRDCLHALGASGLEHPIAPPEPLFHSALAHSVQLAHRKKEVAVQRQIVDLGEREWRLAKATELFAEQRAIELAIRRRRELNFAANFHRLASAHEEGLQVRADRSKDADVEPHLLLLWRALDACVALSRTRQQARM